MAKVIGEIKPDWSVVKYETETDYRVLHKTFEDLKATTGIYELCRGLQALDDEFNPNHTISQINVILNANNPFVRIKMTPCITDMAELRGLVTKINKHFINDEWFTFPSYEKMVKRVATDYDEWLQYASEKKEWDLEQTWSPTDSGYNLVFPIWRDVQRIINGE